jgi:hypothetical protein
MSAPHITTPGRKLTTRNLCDRFNISTRTVDRWTKDPTLGFPRPLYIHRRKYWDEAALIAWERSLACEVTA